MESPQTVCQILTSLSLTELARELGHTSLSTVSGWRRRGRVPAQYWKTIVALARKRDIPGITLGALVEAHSGLRPQGAPPTESVPRIVRLMGDLDWSRPVMAGYLGLTQRSVSRMAMGQPETGPVSKVLDQLEAVLSAVSAAAPGGLRTTGLAFEPARRTSRARRD
jgi:hypothetical protein